MIQDEQHFPVESESLGPLEDRKYMTRVGISQKILVHFFRVQMQETEKKIVYSKGRVGTVRSLAAPGQVP